MRTWMISSIPLSARALPTTVLTYAHVIVKGTDVQLELRIGAQDAQNEAVSRLNRERPGARVAFAGDRRRHPQKTR